MKIPRSYIENYSAALNTVSERSREALIDALSGIDYTADIADVRNAVIAVMQPACGASTTVAARLAADFYDGLRLQFGIDDGYKASIETMREPEATDGAVRAFVQDLVDGKPTEQFIGKCADRIDAETRRAANECMAFNAQHDPEKPRWARVPVVTPTIYKPWSKERGVTHNAYLAQHGTCQFCMMLASRGFVYHSEELASHAHPGCDCRVIPSWDKKNPAIQGYDPDEYYQKWKHPEKYKSEIAPSEPVAAVKMVSVDGSTYPDKFSNTKGKKQNLQAFTDAVNAVEGADPKMREIYSRIGDISKSPLMPSGDNFDVKYSAGNGCVSVWEKWGTGEVAKMTVSVPKMTADNIKGTYRTTCHELGHYIDVLLGNDASAWLSSKYVSFLKTDYISLPVEERRAAAAQHIESVRPKGKILEVMRNADVKYKAAVEKTDAWYRVESAKISKDYQDAIDGGADRYEAYSANLKSRKKLKREYEKQRDIACREAMGGVEQLEDIYDALNDGNLRGTTVDGVEVRYGHGSKYYRTTSKKVEEIWANYCSLSLTRPDLIELLRDDQPNLVASMDSMRDDILGGLNG